MDNRDMYYGSYGYGAGFNPNMMPQQNMQQFPSNNTYSSSQLNDMNDRINRLERQIKRLDQRLTRLETPYANNLQNNEPDNNMYMM